MTMNRRGFLAGSTAAVAGAGLVCAAKAAEVTLPQPPREAVLKLSSQLGVIPGKELPEKLAWMEQAGFDAVEPHGNVVGNEQEFLAALRNTKLKVSALCWGSAKGALVSREAAQRTEAVEQFKRAVDTAAELKSAGVVHAPVFKWETDRTNQEIREILVDTLPGQDREEDEPRYLDGFRGLKLIGYQDYCSFECGCRGNREEEIPKSMTFLRECWAKA